mmetsp:Transcript_43124/g.88249  ORF Transcript_43124/g.88249 Transcript_43124/m.88249 type:complete len:727 (-) Transcript_43124:46-2226(-)|eukprot:CAMPEP_0181296192 /NCGR_PEP_ID=MMETSP1101-20121128/4565_1 /TAXON_ID=46948 /ORGANISM="Rhodomonas abbreviata, Strain Caron Lab Isolate" /LENGTH=726 /DNA_ID=CAMNT_0023401025 /DNA_START=83 /DNA_END=2263 /DNA_ORIENTATION=+
MQEVEANLIEQQEELCALRSIFPDEYKQGVVHSSLCGNGDKGCDGFDHHLLVNLDVSSVKVGLEVTKGDLSLSKHDMQSALNQAAATLSSTPMVEDSGGSDEKPGIADETGNLVCHEDSVSSVASKLSTPRRVTPEDVNASLDLKFLPPIVLSWSYSDGYPSSCLPDFRLSCGWLEADHLTRINRALVKLAEESAGMPLIFSWYSFLSDELLELLNMKDRIVIQASQSRAKTLIDFSNQMADKSYKEGWHLCELCFDDKQGSQFHTLSCSHSFCTQCLSSMAAVHVTEGSLAALCCPVPDCASPFCPGTLRSLLNEELLQRWDQLNTNKELESLGSVMYCPRCDPSTLADPRAATLCPALCDGGDCREVNSCPYVHNQDDVLEPVACFPEINADFLYICPRCSFSFCGQCTQSYHPGVGCEDQSLDAEQYQQRLEKLQEEGTPRHRDLIRQIQQKRAIILTEKCIVQSARRCPKCGVPIEKSGGCNHMTCGSCKTHFCWLCLTIMDPKCPYAHFSECKLSDNAFAPAPEAGVLNRKTKFGFSELQRAEREAAKVIPTIVCPSCRGRVFKSTNNNHIACENCATPLCFLCRKVLRKVAGHFSPSHPQHTDLDSEKVAGKGQAAARTQPATTNKKNSAAAPELGAAGGGDDGRPAAALAAGAWVRTREDQDPNRPAGQKDQRDEHDEDGEQAEQTQDGSDSDESVGLFGLFDDSDDDDEHLVRGGPRP